MESDKKVERHKEISRIWQKSIQTLESLDSQMPENYEQPELLKKLTGLIAEAEAHLKIAFDKYQQVKWESQISHIERGCVETEEGNFEWDPFWFSNEEEKDLFKTLKKFSTKNTTKLKKVLLLYVDPLDLEGGNCSISLFTKTEK